MPARTLVHALRQRAEAQPNLPALWRKQGDSPYRPLTWRELALASSRAGRGLLSLSLLADRPIAALCGHRWQWLPLELGAMGAGFALAPLFRSWPDELVSDVLGGLRSKVVVVDGARQLERLLSLRAGLPELERIVCLDAPEGAAPAEVLSFSALQTLGDPQPETAWLSRLEALEPDAVAAVSASAGTTGAPTLVRHSHAALLAHATRLAEVLGVGEGDMLLSRLSPAFGLERALLRLSPLTGAQVSVPAAEGSFLSQLRDARPTLVHGRPEDFEALRRTLEEKLESEPPNKQRVLSWSRRLALQCQLLDDDYQPVPGPDQARLKVAQTLVFQPLKLEAGLHVARALVCAQGPVRRSTLEFFSSLDLPLGETWGLAEAGGPVTFNVRDARRLGSQGRPLPGVAVRIADDGEILLRTPTACLPGTGGATLDRHGWLHTGDLGDLEPEGFLRVRGRVDERLGARGTSGPAAEAVEARLRSAPLVEQAVCFPDGRERVALLSLDPDRAARLSRERGLPEDPAVLATHPALLAVLERDLALAQAEAPEEERVTRFAVVPGGLSQKDGELTPAGSVRRAVVAQRRRALLEPLRRGRSRKARSEPGL